MADKKLSSFDKKVNIFVAVFLLVIFSFVLLITNTGKIEFSVNEEKLEISSPYWSEYSVLLKDIESIEYTETDSKGSRTSGFGSMKLLMGVFENDAFGKYLRYSYTKCTSCIAITDINKKVLVISKETNEETLEFYNQLKSFINQ
ncbi:MAG: hypothetical protein IKL10_06485 [Clostridia bacterium]|nr:hypothetical protein [Clostridia bacterium]